MLLPQLYIIKNFPIEGNPIPTARIAHRLVGAVARGNYRQALVQKHAINRLAQTAQ